MPIDAEYSGSNCRSEYHKRMNLVLDYIDNNFSSKLSVEILAGIARFSPYHFHRIFHSILGENINEYVKRIRLSKAAYRLLYCPKLTITNIAFECGFSSLSDFSRSFKAYYGISPTEYSQKKEAGIGFGENLSVSARPRLNGGKTELPDKCVGPVRTLLLPDLHVAYIRCAGLSKKLENKNIEYAFARLLRWGKPRGIIDNKTLILGITLDSPEIVPMGQCRYDACITVPQGTVFEGEIGIRTLKSEGTYAAFTFARNKPDANEVFFNIADYIYGYWIPMNGYLPDNKPFIEFYRQDADTGDILTDFHIPLKPF